MGWLVFQLHQLPISTFGVGGSGEGTELGRGRGRAGPQGGWDPMMASTAGFYSWPWPQQPDMGLHNSPGKIASGEPRRTSAGCGAFPWEGDKCLGAAWLPQDFGTADSKRARKFRIGLPGTNWERTVVCMDNALLQEADSWILNKLLLEMNRSLQHKSTREKQCWSTYSVNWGRLKSLWSRQTSILYNKLNAKWMCLYAYKAVSRAIRHKNLRLTWCWGSLCKSPLGCESSNVANLC